MDVGFGSVDNEAIDLAPRDRGDGNSPAFHRHPWRYTALVDSSSSLVPRRHLLGNACRSFGVAAVYLFGSRADDGLRVLQGENIPSEGSDLDVGLHFADAGDSVRQLAELQVAIEGVFAPLRVDLVPLHRVDALFQFRAIDGHRVYVQEDTIAVDRWELVVMRRAADLLPIQRRIERDIFGVSTS